MNHCSSTAIVLRRRSYGDYDLILTVLTRDFGKQTLIAKSAKKSTKRFGGILEPFADLQVVYRLGRGKGMPVLEEAELIQAFESLRSNILKTAYASYWVELIALWLEEKQERPDIYKLLTFVLRSLSEDHMPAAMLNIVFQMRFVGQEGLKPVLERCTCCQKQIQALSQQQFCIDLNNGGVVCNYCPSQSHGRLHLTKGTLMQLQWMVDGSMTKALRARLSPKALSEATIFLEAFLPYHIGRNPKSLSFLKQIRRSDKG